MTSLIFYKMNRQVYLCLLILCEILSRGVFALSEENGNSEDIHVRNKRLIGSERIPLRDARHVVNILSNGKRNCVGSLLSPGFAITATHCFLDLDHERPKFSMLSGSETPDSGIHHNITHIIRYPGFNSGEDPHDLSLFKFLPLINERSRNRPIKLYSGSLPLNSRGTAIGWGCHMILSGGRRQFPCQLRSVTMSIISLEECRRRYRHTNFSITNNFICTFENGAKRCDFGDSGAPLVVNGYLVGVMSWNQECHHPVPDVFMNLLHKDYRAWISHFVPSALERI